jgi:cobalt-zinc-cadmium efflux system protein
VIAVALNLLFVGVETIAGLAANSTALVADAAHNLGDVLGLALAWGALLLSRRSPTARHTYGLRKTTILAAVANALLLLMVSGGVAWEAVQRFSEPRPILTTVVMGTAAVGVVINSASAALFLRQARRDANIRGALLHLVSDAAVSAGVVVAGAVLYWRPSWTWVDGAASIAIAVVILYGTWALLRDAVHLSVDGVPQGIELAQVRKFLRELPGVMALHDLHVWAMSTSEVALTAHLVVERPGNSELVANASAELHRRFGIHHSTIQLDSPETASDCQPC